MNKKMRELKQVIQNKQAEAKNLLEEGKKAEVKALIQEIQDLKEDYEIQEQLLEDEKETVEVKNKEVKAKAKSEQSIEMKAFMNHVSGKPLTEEMKAALTTTEAGVLIPAELVDQIVEERRQLVSLRDFVTVVPVTSQKGSIPMEDLSAGLQMLIDFDGDTELAEQTPKFKNIPFALKEKGAITPVSNSVLTDSIGSLQPYIVKDFTKKAVRTENKDILDAINGAKTAKAFTNLDSIRKSINKDIDPAAKIDGVFITNQDGYDLLDGEVDGNGRPLLTNSVADADIKLFKGLQVVVLSNAELPTAAGKAPVIFGSLKAGAMFFDKNEYTVSVSDQAAFAKNQTLFKVTERYDAAAADTNAYVVGTLTIA